jgi:hypothetical protein
MRGHSRQRTVFIPLAPSPFLAPLMANLPPLTKPPLRIGYNRGSGTEIVPDIHHNPRFFKTLHFDTQCLQDFASFTYRQVST